MGIGLGIDYSIYIAARIREEILRGQGNPDLFGAIQKALSNLRKGSVFHGDGYQYRCTRLDLFQY